jgi:dipeptidyl aminopeptidase/acylaminoacyl peptidase
LTVCIELVLFNAGLPAETVAARPDGRLSGGIGEKRCATGGCDCQAVECLRSASHDRSFCLSRSFNFSVESVGLSQRRKADSMLPANHTCRGFVVTLGALLLSFAVHPARADVCTDGGPVPIALTDTDCIKLPSDPQISRDGKYIAYRQRDRLSVMSVADGRVVDMFHSNSGRLPAWSNSSNDLYYVAADSDGSKRLFKVTMAGNFVPEALPCPGSLGRIKLSPDNSRILLESNAKSGPLADCLGGKKPKAIEINSMDYKLDGSGYLGDTGGNRIHVLELANGHTTQLTEDDRSPASPEPLPNDKDATWSPDGKQIAFFREYPDKLEYRTELWVTSAKNPADGPPTRLLSAGAERQSLAWSRDGKWLAYIWTDQRLAPYAVPQLAVYAIDQKKERVLTGSLDRSVISFRFSADARFIYFVYADEGGRHLARVALDDGRIERLLTGNRYISSFDISNDDHIVMRMNGPDDATDLWLYKPGEEPKNLSNFHKSFFANRQLAPKEKLYVESRGRRLYEMFVTRPVNFDPSRKYPAVLIVHGGPIDSQHKFGYDFFPQFLAANGYIVIEPNPPGSEGQPQSMWDRIRRNWGCTAYPDILLSVDRLIARGWVDPKKLYVTGVSYGGYMTNCLIGRVPDKFRAAASAAGHSDIAASFGYDGWLKWYKSELGLPWLNRARYRQISPLSRVARIKTPTLFLGGTEDWNVPLMNSELLYQALKIRGIEARLVVYRGMSHNGWFNQQGDWSERILDWFNDHGGNSR